LLKTGAVMNTSEFLIERLYKWGIRRIYGYPGDGINGIMGALNKERQKIDFIQTRHEEIAAFMACAHAKFTGEIGVCIATSGPGAVHLLNGLYDAKLDNQPVLAIIGQQSTMSLGADYQQEIDLISLFKDVAHEYVHMASTPSQVRQLVDRSIRIAKSERTVTCIIIPNDIQEMPAVTAPPRKHGANYTGIGFSESNIIPTHESLEAASDILNAGEKVAILAGAGALGAEKELMDVAHLMGAGVAKALLGKSVLPDDLSYVTGPIGLLGSKPSWDMMMECDTLFVIGSSFPYSEFLPKEGQAKGIQIDIRPRMLSLRYPMNVNLHGDTKLTLQALIPLLKYKEKRKWLEKINNGIKEWWQILEARALHSAKPINPQRIFWELNKKLPDNCILTSDSGSVSNWWARDLKIRKGMKASLSGNLATMCPAVPYALAAKINFPELPVIATIGDGAMQMLGINCLIDISKYWKEWKNPFLVIIVLNNKDLNQVTWEQRIMNADPKFEASQNLPPFNYAKLAQILDLTGIEVNEPDQIVPALNQAFTSDRPSVIDIHCDPDTPILPPHINIEQAKGFLSSIMQGDPNMLGMVSQTIKEGISSIRK
jgi:pyruvate dehydrogenase (quinone)